MRADRDRDKLRTKGPVGWSRRIRRMGKRKRRQSRSVGAPQWVAIAGVAALAIVAGGLTVAALARDDSAQAGAAQVSPPATYGAAAPQLTAVSVLSDSHAYNEGSWWRQTVEAGTISGVRMGAFESQPGASAQVLVERLDAAAARGGFVIVQAGTNDLLGGITPADTTSRIVSLWDGIAQRGATPVAALVPPSNTRADETVELNALIREAAAARGIGVLDVYTDVALPDGEWQDGASGDGIHALPDAATRMAAAAAAQLPALLAA
ncbi:hypothetical protein GMYAFLOJ_CDS0004 [Microbacterium phage phiMiGM15]